MHMCKNRALHIFNCDHICETMFGSVLYKNFCVLMIVTLFRNTALSLVINSKLQKQYEVISLRFQPHSVYPYMYTYVHVRMRFVGVFDNTFDNENTTGLKSF